MTTAVCCYSLYPFACIMLSRDPKPLYESMRKFVNPMLCDIVLVSCFADWLSVLDEDSCGANAIQNSIGYILSHVILS